MSMVSIQKPEKVFQYFEKICSIPHGSRNVEKISNYLVSFAKEHGLKYRQDEKYNVIIWKDGSTGYEQSEPLIIQGHMDMVAVKTADCEKESGDRRTGSGDRWRLSAGKGNFSWW